MFDDVELAAAGCNGCSARLLSEKSPVAPKPRRGVGSVETPEWPAHNEGSTMTKPDQSITDIPEATLEQLGLANANFGFPFEPQYCAMDDGIDCPAGCWHLFEDLPSFDPVTLSWKNDGNAWEVGVDDSEDLHDTPEFQRWVKAGFSLVRVVKHATAAPQYHPLAYMTPAA
ncbi:MULTISPECIES: hypothetical protein [Pseudomonas syringae group]|uniref:hypothetical protein n=2 Tax=Pseudomonas TaxID=286 RepID=UPI0012B8F3CB|nr:MULTISPECIES: hypothetical protein [Pseudomonas syringae group]